MLRGESESLLSPSWSGHILSTFVEQPCWLLEHVTCRRVRTEARAVAEKASSCSQACEVAWDGLGMGAFLARFIRGWG